MIVVFVGDRPSEKNNSQCIPFVGTQSYKRLREWCNKYELKPYLLNSHTPYWINLAKNLEKQGVPVVALGKQASSRLTCAGVRHFRAPHPSGLNRQINDAERLDRNLQELVVWAKSITKLN